MGAPFYNYYIRDRSVQERDAAEACAGLGDAAFEEAWAHGRKISFEQAVEYTSGADAAHGGSVSP